MSAPRRTVIYRALHRPNLFLGGERELVLLTAIVCAVLLPATSMNLPAFAIGFGLWVFLAAVLRMMAKADPLMSKVYLRQLNYAAYYPPRSRASRPD